MEARSSNAILIVDDDADMRDTMTDVLQAEGYKVIAVPGGPEALRLLEEGLRPALILLDMMMPGMDGRQFRAEQTKHSDWAAIPTVVFSAYGDVAETASEIGAAGGLAKPLRMDALLELIERFVSGQGASQTPAGPI